jgi:hypothetical protein
MYSSLFCRSDSAWIIWPTWSKKYKGSRTSQIGVNNLVLRSYGGIQIHKMYVSDVALDQQQLLEGLIEVQIQKARFLQPKIQRSIFLMNSLCITITTQNAKCLWKIEVTWTITNFRLHFWTIFKNVSHAMSWKILRCMLQSS